MKHQQARTERENTQMARRLVAAVLGASRSLYNEDQIAELNLLVFQMLEDWPI